MFAHDAQDMDRIVYESLNVAGVAELETHDCRKVTANFMNITEQVTNYLGMWEIIVYRKYQNGSP